MAKRVIKNARKKVAAARNSAVKKVGATSKRVAQKAGATVKKVANAGGTAALLPFVLVMNAAIKNKGGQPEKDLLKKARQFQKLVINKNFQDADNLGFDTTDYLEENNLVGDVASIVKDVVDFIKKLESKKKSGMATEEEKEELAEAEKGISQAVAQENADSVGGAVSEALKSPTTLIIAALVIALIGYFIVKK